METAELVLCCGVLIWVAILFVDNAILQQEQVIIDDEAPALNLNFLLELYQQKQRPYKIPFHKSKLLLFVNI